MTKLPVALLRLAVWMLAVTTCVLILVTIVVPRINGWVPLTILTSSMEPTIHAGDLVFVDPEATKDPKVGQVVAFMPTENDASVVYTHRLVSVTYGPAGVAEFMTRGDANPTDDEPLPIEAIRGTVVSNGSVPVVIPKIGEAFLEVTKAKNNLNFDAVEPLIAWVLVGGGAIYLLRYMVRGRGPAGPRAREQHETPPEDPAGSGGIHELRTEKR